MFTASVSKTNKPKRRKMSRQEKKNNLILYAIMSPVLIFVFIFSYIPMYGIVVAFQDYVPGSNFLSLNANWVGLKHFETFIHSTYFWRLIESTKPPAMLGRIV